MGSMEIIPYDVSEKSFETTKSDYAIGILRECLMEGTIQN